MYFGWGRTGFDLVVGLYCILLIFLHPTTALEILAFQLNHYDLLLGRLSPVHLYNPLQDTFVKVFMSYISCHSHEVGKYCYQGPTHQLGETEHCPTLSKKPDIF